MFEISLDTSRLENVKHLDGGAIRAACPACRKSDSDKSGEHLLIQAGGKYGCAANPKDREHRQEIFRLAGIKTTPRPAIVAPPAKPQFKKEFVCAYDYHDASGKLLFQVERYKTNNPDKPKTFLQRQPDGKGGWNYNMDGVEKVLFRLPEIVRAIAGGKFIFLCEGCKDVLAMVERGFDSTCNSGGAAKKADGEKWLNGYTETLRGADVCIIADKDGDGRKHAQIVAGKLHGVAKSVRVIELPDTSGNAVKDAADFFVAGGTAETIFELVDAAPIWTPAAQDPLPGNEDPPEPTAPQLDIAARLAMVRFNIHTPPPMETAVFKLSTGAVTHTRGNISAITAQAKAGKSALNAALIAGGIATNPDDCDGLGFRAVNPDGLPLALLDTEHSPAHNWKLGDRILRRAMLAESDRLFIYRLAGFSVRELNAALDYLLKERKWHSVFLDGTGDFVSDVNDAEECNAFVSRLHGLAIEHDTHIFNVLHLNPTSETKSRGHLGSQLERKSETNLRIEKKDGVSIVYSDRNRGADIPKDTAPRFIWSIEHQMHVSADSIGNIKQAANLEVLRDQCREAFQTSGKPALSWTDLVKSLRKVPGVKSDRTAERIHTEAKAAKIIAKNIIGQWELA